MVPRSRPSEASVLPFRGSPRSRQRQLRALLVEAQSAVADALAGDEDAVFEGHRALNAAVVLLLKREAV